jgi:hypothetical protein
MILAEIKAVEESNDFMVRELCYYRAICLRLCRKIDLLRAVVLDANINKYILIASVIK